MMSRWLRSFNPIKKLHRLFHICGEHDQTAIHAKVTFHANFIGAEGQKFGVRRTEMQSSRGLHRSGLER